MHIIRAIAKLIREGWFHSLLEHKLSTELATEELGA